MPRSVEVEEARQQLGPDDQHVASQAAAHVGVGGGVAEDEAGTGSPDIEGSRRGVADGLLHQGGGGGHGVVGREGGHHDDVDFVRLQTGRGDGTLAGDGGERGRGLVGRRDPPLADAGASPDPLVRRVHDALEIGVAQDALRDIGAPAGDANAAWRTRLGRRSPHVGSTSMSV